MGVPNQVIVPFVGVEFDSSRSGNGTGDLTFNALLLGHSSNGSTLATDVPILVLNADDVAAKAGIGSLLHQMAVRWFSQNKFTKTYICNIAQPTGVAQVYTVTYAGTATKAGTANIYIDGQKFSAGVAIGDTAAVTATALAAAINLYPDRHCFTAVATLGAIALTASYKGVTSAQHDIRTNYADSDVSIPGLTVAITISTPGSGAAALTGAINGIKGSWFQVMVNPFNDSTNMDLLETELLRRFGPTVQQDGICYQGMSDTAANTITFATNVARNSQSMVLIDCYKYTQHPVFIAALCASLIAESAENDPGQPLHRITISSLLPPLASERYDASTLNTLTKSGVMTLDPNAFGGPQTYGMVTMYLKNSSGIPDASYQYQTSLYILMRLRYDFVAMITTKYARARLADSATKIQSGLQIITPALGRAEAIALARDWESRGLIENIEVFKSEIICQRSSTNPNRLDWILPPDLVNQFIVGSANMQFYLQ